MSKTDDHLRDHGFIIAGNSFLDPYEADREDRKAEQKFSQLRSASVTSKAYCDEFQNKPAGSFGDT